MTVISTFGFEAPNNAESGNAPAFAQPTLDPEEYRQDLEGLGLTEAQENELLAALWPMMGAFARIARRMRNKPRGACAPA